MKWAGVAMIVGAVLMLVRMAPIFMVIPEDMAFPPQTTLELIRLVGIAGYRWQLSHALGLVAVAMFAAGYHLHSVILLKRGFRKIGIIAGVLALFSFGLFAIALIVDGFILPRFAIDHAANMTATSLSATQAVHDRALSFFTPGALLMFVSMVMLSAPMLHRGFHSRWLGGIGQLIGVCAVTAYFFGATGPNWDDMRIGGTLMLAGFAWHLLVGISCLATHRTNP